ncbi:MAG TPA: hypothetical protein VN768_02745 [Acidimicrobiales bacterium]|nr:hypothetical protein [Acidimicrobiales bacterium]
MKLTTRLQQVLVAAYPPSFRHRYGEEMLCLVADGGHRWRDVLDLALGVGRAWVAPVFAGAPLHQRRLRLQATTVTVLGVWCASLLAAAVFSKAVNDPPLPGLHGVASGALDVGGVVLVVTAAIVLATGFCFWLALIVPAWRARRREVVVPALGPALFVAAWLGVTGLVALFARHDVRSANVSLHGPRGALIVAVLLGWVAVTVACVAGCAISAARALRRAQVRVTRLAASTVVAGVAAVGVGAQAVAGVVCLAQLGRAGGGLQGRDTVFGTAAVAVLVIGTGVAVVSVTRGLKAVRSGPVSS